MRNNQIIGSGNTISSLHRYLAAALVQARLLAIVIGNENTFLLGFPPGSYGRKSSEIVNISVNLYSALRSVYTIGPE